MSRMLILTAAFVLFGADASAQVSCSQRDKIVSLFAAKYKEVPVAVGVNSKGGLVEVLSSEHGHTWTIIVTSAKGLSCVVAVGEGWRTRQEKEHLAEPQA